tara:strand:+ start:800 stop:1033 length:234 start_codon:yes stop_codon:yes gene_type:complete
MASKIKEHFHEEITYSQQDNPKEIILSQHQRIHLKTLISLALLNHSAIDELKGMTTFYLSEESINILNEIRDEFDRL